MYLYKSSARKRNNIDIKMNWWYIEARSSIHAISAIHGVGAMTNTESEEEKSGFVYGYKEDDGMVQCSGQ